MPRKIISSIVTASLFAFPLLSMAAALEPPLGSASTDPAALVAKVINIMLGLLGGASLIIFIYGGFLLLLSGGNKETITKAKNTLVWAVIGLLIIFSSYGIVKYIFEKLQ